MGHEEWRWKLLKTWLGGPKKGQEFKYSVEEKYQYLNSSEVHFNPVQVRLTSAFNTKIGGPIDVSYGKFYGSSGSSDCAPELPKEGQDVYAVAHRHWWADRARTKITWTNEKGLTPSGWVWNECIEVVPEPDLNVGDWVRPLVGSNLYGKVIEIDKGLYPNHIAVKFPNDEGEFSRHQLKKLNVYKVGDWFKCVKTGHARNGEFFRVASLLVKDQYLNAGYDLVFHIADVEKVNGSSEEEEKEASPVKSKVAVYKEGDKVKVIKNNPNTGRGNSSFPVGSICTVLLYKADSHWGSNSNERGSVDIKLEGHNPDRWGYMLSEVELVKEKPKFLVHDLVIITEQGSGHRNKMREVMEVNEAHKSVSLRDPFSGSDLWFGQGEVTRVSDAPFDYKVGDWVKVIEWRSDATLSKAQPGIGAVRQITRVIDQEGGQYRRVECGTLTLCIGEFERTKAPVTTLQPGDRVSLLIPIAGWPAGTFGTIEKVGPCTDSDVKVSPDCGTDGFWALPFNLKKEPPQFKIGDYVTVINYDKKGEKHCDGSVGEVIEVNTDHSECRIRTTTGNWWYFQFKNLAKTVKPDSEPLVVVDVLSKALNDFAALAGITGGGLTTLEKIEKVKTFIKTGKEAQDKLTIVRPKLNELHRIASCTLSTTDMDPVTAVGQLWQAFKAKDAQLLDKTDRLRAAMKEGEGLYASIKLHTQSHAELQKSYQDALKVRETLSKELTDQDEQMQKILKQKNELSSQVDELNGACGHWYNSNHKNQLEACETRIELNKIKDQVKIYGPGQDPAGIDPKGRVGYFDEEGVPRSVGRSHEGTSAITQADVEMAVIEKDHQQQLAIHGMIRLIILLGAMFLSLSMYMGKI